MPAYATRSELTVLSISAAALSGVATADQDSALAAASSLADGYLTRRFTLPLTAWGADLKQAVCDIAAYRLLKARGFSPSAGDAEQLRLGHEDALRWLREVGDGKAVPQGVVDSSAGGVNDTDAAGELAQAQAPFVVQPQADSQTADTFWSRGGTTTGGVGPPKRRGW